MPQPHASTLELDQRDLSRALVENIDPAIGEATSVIGAVMTELMRRSLRGGVMKIGDELQSFVAERVDATIADKTSVIEQTASAAAEVTARSVAATVAEEEVKALEQWTKEATQELATQVVDVERRAREQTTETAEKLTGKIVEAEKRAEETAQSQMRQQMQDLLQRSRKSSTAWKTRLKALASVTAELRKQLAEEKVEVQQAVAQLLQRLDHATKERRAAEDVLRQELAKAAQDNHLQMLAELQELRQANQALSARVADLEKPRGFTAKVANFFRRKKE